MEEKAPWLLGEAGSMGHFIRPLPPKRTSPSLPFTPQFPIPPAGCSPMPTAWVCGRRPPPHFLSSPACPPGPAAPSGRSPGSGRLPGSGPRPAPPASKIRPGPPPCARHFLPAQRRPGGVSAATSEPWSRWRTRRAARRRRRRLGTYLAGGGRCERGGAGGARPPGLRGPLSSIYPPSHSPKPAPPL